MAIFNVESDKMFLQSIGDGEVSVYEIESLDIALLQDEHWSDPSTIHFGKRQEFQILKVGDIEIKGRDLTTFLEDLRDSRLMVNREGLCILPTSKIASEEFEVEYYRMFDLFDWSKYRVKSSLTTKWSPSDVLTGRTILAAQSPNREHEKLEQRVKELEDEKRKRESEVKELEYEKRKHQKELAELLARSIKQNENRLVDQNRKHQKELTELAGSIKQNENNFRWKEHRVTELEGEMEDQKRKHQKEVEKLEQKLKALEKDLEDQKNLKEEREKRYMSFVISARIPYRSIVVTQNHNLIRGIMGITRSRVRNASIIEAPLTMSAANMLRVTKMKAVVKDEFDTENWWFLKVAIDSVKYVFIYYDGDFGYYSIDDSTVRMPIPIKNGSTTELDYSNGIYQCHVEGLGLRYGKLISND